jgi:hypothetical protein
LLHGLITFHEKCAFCEANQRLGEQLAHLWIPKLEAKSDKKGRKNRPRFRHRFWKDLFGFWVISGSILGSFLETLELGNGARSGTNRNCEKAVLPCVLQVKSKVAVSQIAPFWLPGKTFSGSSNEVVCVLAEGSEKYGK